MKQPRQLKLPRRIQARVKRVVEGSSVDLEPGDIVTLLQLAAPGRETDGGKSDGGKRDE